MHGCCVVIPQLGNGDQSLERNCRYDTKVANSHSHASQQKMHNPVQLIKKLKKPTFGATGPCSEDDFVATRNAFLQQEGNVTGFIFSVAIHNNQILAIHIRFDVRQSGCYCALMSKIAAEGEYVNALNR